MGAHHKQPPGQAGLRERPFALPPKQHLFAISLQDVYAEGGGLPPVFWDTLRLLSLKALTTPGLFRPHAVGRSCNHSQCQQWLRPGALQQRRFSSAASLPARIVANHGSRDCTAPRRRTRGSARAVVARSLLCKRLYDSGQDALKVLPSTSRDLHAVRALLQLVCAHADACRSPALLGSGHFVPRGRS